EDDASATAAIAPVRFACVDGAFTTADVASVRFACGWGLRCTAWCGLRCGLAGLWCPWGRAIGFGVGKLPFGVFTGGFKARAANAAGSEPSGEDVCVATPLPVVPPDDPAVVPPSVPPDEPSPAGGVWPVSDGGVCEPPSVGDPEGGSKLASPPIR